jgi:hypothetical protein
MKKHDWERMKKEYFESPFDEVQVFLREKYGMGKKAESGQTFRKTKGWRDEKTTWKRDLLRKSKNEIEKTYKLDMSLLYQTKALVYESLFKMMHKGIETDPDTGEITKVSLSPRNIKYIWEMIKIELGENIQTSRNEISTEQNEGEKLRLQLQKAFANLPDSI